MTTDSGLTVNVPVAGDQAWAAPLPSTPYADPGLRATVDAAGRIRRFDLDPRRPPRLVP